jgi:N-acetylglucosamine-6-phosphate deacetylase
MKRVIKNCQLILSENVLFHGAVVIDDQGKIIFSGRESELPEIDGEELDLEGKFLSPGFIDIHVHGGNGITFGEGDLAAGLTDYSKWVSRNGVTGFLTSITGSSPKELVEKIQALVVEFEKGLPGARGLGIHLEGPFMNIEKKGAQNPDWIRNPSLEETEMYLNAGKGWIKQVTIAPELPDAEKVAARFSNAGVVVAIGHSTADYETAVKALTSYWTLVTHTFNAQTGLHHRKPGIVGAVLTSENVTAELIADLVHVHPGAMKALVRCIGSNQVVLVTDAMEAAGLQDGVYHLLGAKVIVKDGKATQEDGTIASSTALLNQCVRNMNRVVGLKMADAVKMASINPARVIGMSELLGSLEIGKWADLTVVDEDFNIYMTMVNGEIVYSRL